MRSFKIISLATLLLFVVGCFSKSGDQKRISLSAAPDVTPVYNTSNLASSYLSASGDCQGFRSMILTYSSPLTSETQVRVDCSSNAQGGMSMSSTSLTISSGEECQVFDVKVAGVYRNERTNTITQTVNYCPPTAATPGFTVSAAGGSVYEAGPTYRGYVTFGEPFGVINQAPTTQTNVSNTNDYNLSGTVHF